MGDSLLHPADFTPVCTTEFVEFAKLHDELEKRNVALLANSIDSVYSHIAWTRNIKEKFGVEIRFRSSPISTRKSPDSMA